MKNGEVLYSRITHGQKNLHAVSRFRDQVVPLTLMMVILFALPLVWPRLLTGQYLYFSEIRLFTPATIGLLSALLLLIHYKRCVNFFSARSSLLFPGLPLAIIMLVALIQYVSFDFYSFRYFCEALLWGTLPLTGAVFHREFKRTLPCFMLIIGMATLIQTLQDVRLGHSLFGVSGNWNWNATLLIITTPFLGSALNIIVSRRTTSADRWRHIPVVLFGLMIAILIIRCDSKAALLAAVVSIIAVCGYPFCRRYSRLCVWSVPILLAIILLSVLLKQHQLVDFFARDVHLPLWHGGLGLIGDYPLLGTGPSLFESFYAPVIPADYYLQYFATDRHTHPHNELLFLGGAFGLPALVAWCVLISGTIKNNLRHLKKRGLTLHHFLLFAFLVMLVHSLFDNILAHWPCRYLFLLLLGVLSAKVARGDTLLKPRNILFPRALRIICFSVAALAAFVMVKMAVNDLLASWYYRNALIARDNGNFIPALKHLDRSMAILPSPQNLYLAALIAGYELKQPQAAINYLRQIKPTTGFDNYVHNHQLMARALAAVNKNSEALPHFEQETRNYPLSIVNIYFHWQTLMRLDRIDEANKMREKLSENLRLKGLDAKMLPLMIRRPELEFYAGDRENPLNE